MSCKNAKNHTFPTEQRKVITHVRNALEGRVGLTVIDDGPVVYTFQCQECGHTSTLETDTLEKVFKGAG